jgi:mono/diheme cytochrome c family protein
MGIGALVLAVAVLGTLAWLWFLVGSSRVRRRRETPPANQSPYLTDEDLESKRLNTTLVGALAASAVLAVIMPVYYLGEADRQEASSEHFDEVAVERGEHWYEEFQCGDCHGPTGGGGGADFVEKRSGLTTSWAAPSINDVLYRYDAEEVRYWLVFGRAGSPMPAWGTEGGGPLNGQQIDELIAYLDAFKVSQPEAVAEVDGAVSRELSRLDNADTTIAEAMTRQRAEIQALLEAPARYEALGDVEDRLVSILAGPAGCTAETAALVGEDCGTEAADADRDGVSDQTEQDLAELVAFVITEAPAGDAATALGRIAFDPESAFSTSEGATPIADLDQAETVVGEIETIVRDLRLAVDAQDRLLETANAGLEFLEAAAAERRFAIDFDALAASFGGDLAQARRAAGLYNAYCARCHTAGYSAGVAFTQEAGSGAFGPSLLGDRSVTQFPDPADHLEFIVNGSENGKAYGLNGMGRGWMPGFGTVLSPDDLMLIVTFERVFE